MDAGMAAALDEDDFARLLRDDTEERTNWLLVAELLASSGARARRDEDSRTARTVLHNLRHLVAQEATTTQVRQLGRFFACFTMAIGSARGAGVDAEVLAGAYAFVDDWID